MFPLAQHLAAGEKGSLQPGVRIEGLVSLVERADQRLVLDLGLFLDLCHELYEAALQDWSRGWLDDLARIVASRCRRWR